MDNPIVLSPHICQKKRAGPSENSLDSAALGFKFKNFNPILNLKFVGLFYPLHKPPG
jgi:hypothetical protein